MKIYIETNQKFGTGYQIHPVVKVDGKVIFDDVVDFEPFDLYKAKKMAGKIAGYLDLKFGLDYKPEDIFIVTDEAMKDNSNRDIILYFTKKKKEILDYAKDVELPDVREDLFDIDDGIPLSYPESCVCLYLAWKQFGLQDKAAAMKRFCEYICLHGYNCGSKRAFKELSKLQVELGKDWIVTRYAVHVKDGRDMLQYILGPEIRRSRKARR